MPKETQYLVMTFETSAGKTATVSIKDINPDATEIQIRNVCNAIVSSNIFEGGTKAEPSDLVRPIKAEIVNKVVVAHDLTV